MSEEQTTEATETTKETETKETKATTKSKKENTSKMTKEQFFEHLDNLTVLELADYIKEFEERYGVSAAAMAAPMAAAPGAQADSQAVEEKTEFNVVLKAIGDKKINVIKTVREVTSLGLKEAKDLVDAYPKVIKENLSKDEAAEIKAKFDAVGATVEVE